ncbi:MAG: translesion DNA synthesis-associated protein ImuA [Thiogranum sp.]
MNLDTLLQRPDVWRGGQVNAAASVVPSGFSELDALLAGGWPQGALTELVMPCQGIGALRLLTPALARLSQDDRWVCWVAPPHIPYAPALVSAGIDLSRVLLVHPKARQDGLWAVEQGLRSGNCGAVLAWPTLDDDDVLRRLQLAAEAGDAIGFLFRSRRCVRRPSAAALRLQLDPGTDGKLSVSVLKRRGGRAADTVHLDTSLQHGSLALHSRTPTTTGHTQPYWQ